VYFFLAGFLVLSGPHPVREQSKALHPVTVGSPKPDFMLPVFQGGDMKRSVSGSMLFFGYWRT
jgi:hypothetical protein